MSLPCIHDVFLLSSYGMSIERVFYSFPMLIFHAPPKRWLQDQICSHDVWISRSRWDLQARGDMPRSHLPPSHASQARGLWSACPRESEKPSLKPGVRHWLLAVTWELNPAPAPLPGGAEKSCKPRHGASGE